MQQTKGYRNFHWLKRNIRTDAPQSLLFVDTESLVTELIGTKVKCDQHTLRLWTASYCRLEKGKVTREKDFSGYTEREFWDVVFGATPASNGLTDKNRVLWIFAHNVGYDATMLKMWREFDDGRLTFRTSDADEESEWNGSACIAGPPTMIKCRVTKNKHTIQVCDTMNYWRTNLDKLGKNLGCEKLAMPSFDAPDRDWFEYCRGDVSVIKTAILKLISMVRNEDLGHFATTAAGQAWNAYRHRWMTQKSILISGNEELNEFERSSYFGGSVKAYFIGDVVTTAPYTDLERQRHKDLPKQINGPVYVLDIQSFWPSIMREMQLPRAIVGVVDNPTVINLKQALEVGCVIANVFISSDHIDFPVKMQKYSNMARGLLWTTLCGPELKLALENDCILKVSKMSVYKTANLFREYVDYFWYKRVAAKNSGDIETVELSKMFLNSLLGKFGQRAVRWMECPEIYPGVPWGEWSEWSSVTNSRENYRSLAWLCQMLHLSGESENSFPAIPAYVTSEGRVRMRQYEQIAGEENCLYSDTDSLHVNEVGYHKIACEGLISMDKLGAFDLKQISHTASYYGPKSYKLNNGLTVAGLSQHAKHIADRVYEQPSYPSLTQLFADYKHLEMIVPYERKTIRYSDMLGRTEFNGRVRPLFLRQQISDG